MKNLTKINYNKETIVIKQNIYESNNQFNERIKFIMKLDELNINKKYIHILSMLWYSKKYLQCKYSSTINKNYNTRLELSHDFN